MEVEEWDTSSSEQNERPEVKAGLNESGFRNQLHEDLRRKNCTISGRETRGEWQGAIDHDHTDRKLGDATQEEER